jgi:anti-sigma factor RsiW
MSKSDEQWVRWTDGKMSPEEAEAFEKTLGDSAAAKVEFAQWQHLREDLRADSGRFSLGTDADFLASQVSRAVREDLADCCSKKEPPSLFPVGRLIWGGLGLTAAACVLALILVPRNDGVPDEARFISQVIEARSANPAGYGATSFAAPDGRGAVIWVQDPGFIPANQRIR